MQNVGTPEAFEYPLIWKYLLSKPVMDLKDLPLFYNLFYSASDDSTRDRRWLFTLLLDGVHTIAVCTMLIGYCTASKARADSSTSLQQDWQILKRRQVVDLLISYLNGGLASDESDMRLSVLKVRDPPRRDAILEWQRSDVVCLAALRPPGQHTSCSPRSRR